LNILKNMGVERKKRTALGASFMKQFLERKKPPRETTCASRRSKKKKKQKKKHRPLGLVVGLQCLLGKRAKTKGGRGGTELPRAYGWTVKPEERRAALCYGRSSGKREVRERKIGLSLSEERKMKGDFRLP